MKKYIFCLMATVLSTGIQPACADQELHVVYTYQSEAFRKVLQEFGDITGTHVRAEYIGVDEVKPNMMAMTEAENTPDAVIIPSDHVGMYPFFKYSEVNPKLFKANIPQRMWASGSSDGKLYGAPIIQGNHLVLYYNKSLVKEPAADWETMLIQKAELQPKGVASLVWNQSSGYLFLPFLDAYGGWPLTNGHVELNTPAMVDALKFYKELWVHHNFPLGCDFNCVRARFKSGKAAYNINGIWDGKEFFEVLGDNLGVAAMPKLNGKKMVSPFSTHVISFPNDSLSGSERGILIQLVDYLQSSAIQQQLWQQTGAIPVEPSAFAYAHTNATGYLQQSLVLLADTKPVPADRAMTFVWDALRKGMIRYQAGLDAKASALYMQQLIERNNASLD